MASGGRDLLPTFNTSPKPNPTSTGLLPSPPRTHPPIRKGQNAHAFLIHVSKLFLLLDSIWIVTIQTHVLCPPNIHLPPPYPPSPSQDFPHLSFPSVFMYTKTLISFSYIYSLSAPFLFSLKASDKREPCEICLGGILRF